MDSLLFERLARFGWRVEHIPEGVLLLGNGSPAVFRTEDSLRVWLEKQKEPRTMRTAIKPILKYPGSKANMVEWVTSFFPAHVHYIEPFFGSGIILLGKAPAAHEVANDLSGDVVNLFRVVRERGKELAAAVEMTPWARDEFMLSYEPCDEPLERARRFCVRTWQGHGSRLGNNTGWKHNGVSGLPRPVALWQQVPGRILAVIERMREVEIENKPAVDIVRYYAGTDVLIYCDPPYVLSTRSDAANGRKMYTHEMTNADHVDLLAALDTHPGPVVLSGYHSALYDERLSKWHTREKKVQAEKGNTRTEVLWLNQVCVDRLGYGPLFE